MTILLYILLTIYLIITIIYSYTFLLSSGNEPIFERLIFLLLIITWPVSLPIFIMSLVVYSVIDPPF